MVMVFLFIYVITWGFLLWAALRILGEHTPLTKCFIWELFDLGLIVLFILLSIGYFLGFKHLIQDPFPEVLLGVLWIIGLGAFIIVRLRLMSRYLECTITKGCLAIIIASLLPYPSFWIFLL